MYSIFKQICFLWSKNRPQTTGPFFNRIILTTYPQGSLSSSVLPYKPWDFVVKTNKKIYVIETNFYSSGGSKLNETARSYKMIAEESSGIEEVEFVWITDGGGWVSARRNLEETFNTMDYLYNIKDMEDGIFIELFK